MYYHAIPFSREICVETLSNIMKTSSNTDSSDLRDFIVLMKLSCNKDKNNFKLS